MFTSFVPNFLGFTAVGVILVAMIGVGVAATVDPRDAANRDWFRLALATPWRFPAVSFLAASAVSVLVALAIPWRAVRWIAQGGAGVALLLAARSRFARSSRGQSRRGDPRSERAVRSHGDAGRTRRAPRPERPGQRRHRPAPRRRPRSAQGPKRRGGAHQSRSRRAGACSNRTSSGRVQLFCRRPRAVNFQDQGPAVARPPTHPRRQT